MNADCLFCKIVAGQIPSTKVYEDDAVLAFMDIGPIIKGHTLVIPKEHFDPMMQMPLPTLNQVMAVVQKIAQAQMKGLKSDGVNILQANGSAAGQVIPHVHFHVVPRFHTDGHHWNWAAKKYDSMGEMSQIAEKIQAALSKEPS